MRLGTRDESLYALKHILITERVGVMARIKRTSDYLDQLNSSGYPKSEYFAKLYRNWKDNLGIEVFTQYLRELWDEKDTIKPKYLGENTYSNFRGISFEEYCFSLLNGVIQELSPAVAIELFWNEKIVVEEFYLFENGEFRKFLKYKNVDLAIGVSENKIIHPFSIISCKVWQSTNWLDEDKSTLDSVSSRYPGVIGYSLCMSIGVPKVSLISAQRTGLRVFDLSLDGRVKEFISEIRTLLQAIHVD